MARRINTAAIDGIIGYRLRRAQMAVFNRFSKAFADVGITPTEYSLLALVRDNPGLRPSQVAAALGVQRANFVALAVRLEARTLIERRSAVDDGRSHVLFLTAAGAELTQTLQIMQDSFEASLVAELGGAEQRERLLRLLTKLG